MAAVEVTISGVLFDKVNRTTQNVVLIGEASLTGLGIGGGPINPPRPSPPGGTPVDPGWVGGTVPVDPGYNPPGVRPPYPSHPIALPGDPWWPKPPTDPPPNPSEPKPPPPDGGWGWSPSYGWGYFPGGGGKPQPGVPGGTPQA